MLRLGLYSGFLLVAALITPQAVFADGGDEAKQDAMQPHLVRVRHELKKYEPKVRRHVITKRRVPEGRLGEVALDTPELDPNATGAGLALLLGSALIFVDRRRRVAA